jgi:hypothetical protein
MIASPFVFENTTFWESLETFGVLELLLLLGWVLCRDKRGQGK